MTSLGNKHLRCAIYTRKSSEEGLEQDFNSLHAQREACEAFIKSQRHEGWQLIKTAYDDGGISGGTMQRPALQRLLEDIRAKKVDIIVVYKVDRLTRSLADFARMVELFDSHGVSFVSVTQQFNTTSSMGRLTLNVLLSFAQFEREVTGERIRDKIKASKAKGIFMGGRVPLGYRVQDRKLLIREDEAATVRHMFQRYLELGSVSELKKELEQQGVRGRAMIDAGSPEVKRPIMAFGAIYQLLRNPVYIGKIRHKHVVHDGQHEPLLDTGLWGAVQKSLDDNRNQRKKSAAPRKTEASLLVGKVVDETGDQLTPAHTVKKGRRLRYYISYRLKFEADPSGWRLPAPALEETVIRSIRDALADSATVARSLQNAGVPASSYATLLRQLRLRAEAIENHELLHTVLTRVDLRRGAMTLYLELRPVIALEAGREVTSVPMSYAVPLELKRRGVETRLVLRNGTEAKRDVDPILIKTIARAVTWFDDLSQGRYKTLNDIAEQNGVSKSYVGDLMKLALLSPNVVERIVAGRQPDALVADHLIKCQDIPLDWDAQADHFGFA